MPRRIGHSDMGSSAGLARRCWPGPSSWSGVKLHAAAWLLVIRCGARDCSRGGTLAIRIPDHERSFTVVRCAEPIFVNVLPTPAKRDRARLEHFRDADVLLIDDGPARYSR